jgi:hypothetical protein
MSKKEPKITPQEAVTKMNKRGIKCYDALVLEDAQSGSTLGIQTYGEPTDAHATLNDGVITFVVHPDNREIGPLDIN